jgi:TolA-binding protein
MRNLSKLGTLAAALGLVAGCASGSSQVRRPEAPANVTYPIAFGNYQRVYNTTYHVVNRYGVVKKASYRYGEIEAEVSQDNSFFDKTRRTILARIFDGGDYWDVECRVLLQVEDSEVESLNEHQPRYNWRTIASDSLMETKLNNEIKSALSGGAWDAKTPLVPDSRAPGSGTKIKVVPPPAQEDDQEGQKGDKPSNLRDAHATPPSTAGAPDRAGGSSTAEQEVEYEQLGMKLMEHGEYPKAVRAFQAAHDSRPNSPFAPYLLAQAYFATGEYADAAAAIREGAARNPDWPRARVDVRNFYADGEELRAQTAKLAAFAKAHPDDGDARLVLGYVTYFSHDYQRAEQVFAGIEQSARSEQERVLAKTYRSLALCELDRARGLEEF